MLLCQSLSAYNFIVRMGMHEFLSKLGVLFVNDNVNTSDNNSNAFWPMILSVRIPINCPRLFGLRGRFRSYCSWSFEVDSLV